MAPSSFFVEIESSGVRYEVPADLPVLDVLEREGFDLNFGCRIGKCALCRQVVTGGEVFHYDSCLTDGQHVEEKFFCPCVSRAPGGEVLRLKL